MKNSILIITIALIMFGCNNIDQNNGADEHEHGAISLTQWTERTELFMEYENPAHGAPVKFIIHLTDITDNTPLNENVDITFRSDHGSIPLKAVKNLRAGIYTPEVTLEKGHYTLEIEISGKYKEKIITDEIHINAEEEHDHESTGHDEDGAEHEFESEEHSAAEEEHEHEGEKHGQVDMEDTGSITFLKEQQWQIDYSTSLVEYRLLSQSIYATADITSKLNNDVIIAAPFTGVILPDHNLTLPLIGDKVSRGDMLVVFTPTVQGDSEQNFAAHFIERESAFKLSLIELDRAKRLYEKEAISLKELQVAQASYDEAKANFGSMTTFVTKYQMEDNNGIEHPDLDFIIQTPLSGTIEQMFFHPGEEIQVGSPMYRVIDNRKVWVKINLPVTAVGKVNNPKRFSFTVHGMESTFNVDESCCKLVSYGNLVEGTNRTVPVIFEVDNTTKKLKLGMFADVNLYTGDERNVLSIPEEALIEDEGNYFVFIQKSGEGFDKKQIKIGIKDNNFVEVVSGLEEGMRVVTKGNYQVKLASQVAGLPDHGHSH